MYECCMPCFKFIETDNALVWQRCLFPKPETGHDPRMIHPVHSGSFPLAIDLIFRPLRQQSDGSRMMRHHATHATSCDPCKRPRSWRNMSHQIFVELLIPIEHSYGLSSWRVPSTGGQGAKDETLWVLTFRSGCILNFRYSQASLAHSGSSWCVACGSTSLHGLCV